MKATLITVQQVRNPLWNETEAAQARLTNQKYPHSDLIEVGPGYVLDDPDCWIHCCPGELNAPPIAEPADDECREAVRYWMEQKRPVAIQQIRVALANIEHIRNPDDKKRLLAMGRAYGLIGADATGDK